MRFLYIYTGHSTQSDIGPNDADLKRVIDCEVDIYQFLDSRFVRLFANGEWEEIPLDGA